MKVNLNSAFLAFSLMFSMSLAAQNTLNTLESSLKWEGKKITGSGHNGSLTFSDSQVKIEDGNIISGVFTVDMTTLTCDDLTADQGKSNLEGHLKSNDFFAVEKFNTATLAISSVDNNNATGILTIKDISHPIKFTLIKNQDIYNASLVFDRSKYDIRFNSGSFFENLGDKLILDEIKLTAELKLK
ncbi:MAG: YceI family protein [Flavobacteriales bacterium]|jgi:polyisoprenoid-binding protein YceI|tara:strand:+ start:108604 stop:109161 length:558 start_codon:yes stop_codon:yes gene_type:complete